MSPPKWPSSWIGRAAQLRLLLVLFFLFVGGFSLPWAQPAEAQSTGGSFGGGSFGGGGGGGGGSYGGGGGSYGSGGGASSHSYGTSSHSYGTSSHSYGTSHHSYEASSGSDDEDDSSGARYRSLADAHPPMSGSNRFALGVGFIFLLVVAVVKLSGWSKSRRYSQQSRHYEPLTAVALVPYAPPVDVSAIHLALDWRVRPALQKRLEELARAGQTTTPGGLTSLLHETVVELRRAEASWLYAGAENALPDLAARAEHQFRAIASEARSRFKLETVRAVDGNVASADAPATRARADEGPGLVVVTLVVAATCEIPDIAQAADPQQLRGLLRELGALNARDMVALEVIWSPSAENDRMSSAELEVLYPELRRMDGNTVVGRVFCGYCHAPFPAEVLRCPSCGAPGTEAKRARA